jgi:hypothetical protein
MKWRKHSDRRKVCDLPGLCPNAQPTLWRKHSCLPRRHSCRRKVRVCCPQRSTLNAPRNLVFNAQRSVFNDLCQRTLSSGRPIYSPRSSRAHDDLVMALALAVWKAEPHKAVPVFTTPLTPGARNDTAAQAAAANVQPKAEPWTLTTG